MSIATTWSTDGTARALARADVPRWVVRSMLLGAALYSLAAFGMWLVSYRHRPDVLITFFGPTVAIALGMAYVGWSLMRPGRILARPGLLVSAIVPLGWIIGAVFEFAMRAGAGPKMIAIAAFQAIVVSTMAVEVIVGAWALLCLDRRQKHLLDEARPFSALVGAPAALSTLARGRPLARSLFVVAALFFVLAALQLPGLLVIAEFNWDRLKTLCAIPAGELERACVDRFLNAELIGQFIVWPVTFLGCLFAGGAIEARARHRTLDTAANAMARNDSDPPILFLRSFRNDQVALAQSYRTPLRWLLGRMRRRHYLDHMLVEEFAAYGPTVALGRPGEPTPPFGVWRSYLHDASDEAWQRRSVSHRVRRPSDHHRCRRHRWRRLGAGVPGPQRPGTEDLVPRFADARCASRKRCALAPGCDNHGREADHGCHLRWRANSRNDLRRDR